MSKNYEMMYILRPNLSEEQIEQEITKYSNLLKEHGAENIEVQQMGKKRLAYPIKKLQDGIYVLLNYTASGKQVAPVERAMRLSEEVIRYLTIILPEKKSVATETETEELVAAEA